MCSSDLLAHYGLTGITLDLAPLFATSNCSLLQHSDTAIPKASYSEQIKETHGQVPVSTYVPFRNGLFLASAASIAIAQDCRVIYYGIHSDDAAGNAYPDCSSTFNTAINTAIYEGSGKSVEVVAPFVGLSKADVIREGLRLGVPYELTWSCYEGASTPCGQCGTCIDREEAFLANGLTDPLYTPL